MQITPAIHALRLPFRVPIAPGNAGGALTDTEVSWI